MTKNRLQYSVIAALICIVSIVLFIMGAIQISNQAAQLEQQLIAVNDDRAGEQRLLDLKRTISDSAAEREQLAGYFLESKSESIDFLNYIDTLARDRRITLVTDGASELTRQERQYLQAEYTASGALVEVESFITLLENIPFASEVTSVTLNRQTAGSWSASITVQVAILTTE